MKSYEWDSRERRLVEVDDPCYDESSDDHQRSILNAGYFSEFNSGDGINTGGSIQVYRNVRESDGRPEYYIDIIGGNSCLGTFVARDFPALVETLRYLEPLLKMMELDQRSNIRVAEDISLER